MSKGQRYDWLSGGSGNLTNVGVSSIGIRAKEALILMEIGNIFITKGEKETALDYFIEAQGLAIGASIFERNK